MSFVALDTPTDADAPRMDAAWLDAHWMPFTDRKSVV